MRLAIGFGASLVLVSACTLGFDEFSFEPGVGGAATGSTTSSGGSGTGTGATSSGGSGTGTGTTSSGGSGTGGTGGAGTGGTGAGVGGMGGMGGMMPTTVVACPDMATPCDVSNGGKCCLEQNGNGATCITNGNCSNGETTVTCDGPSDCPGEECCGDFDFQDQEYDALSCSSFCGAGGVTVCDGNDDCGPIEDCQMSMYLPTGYEVCL